MVTRWGLSERLGPLSYGEEEGEVFLGKSVTTHKNVSDDTAHAIEEEMSAFIDRNYDRAHKILTNHMNQLHAMTDALMKYETIDKEQIKDIMAGKKPQPPADWAGTDLDSNDDDDGDTAAPEEKAKKDDKGEGSIGDPASQH